MPGAMMSKTEMDEIDQKARETEYIKSGGYRCPWCKSQRLRVSTPDVDPGIITQDVTCGDCGKRWRDWYELTRFEELK